MNKVAVAILNWNGKKFLEQFLPSVLQHSSNDAAIYVIDNGSTDDSIAFLQQKYPSIKVIINNKNHGFAGGYNQGLKNIDAEYFVLLNSDVEVTANWIRPVIDLMKQSNLIAACQPKIKDYNKKSHFEYAGAAGGMMDDFGYTFCKGRLFDTIEEDNGQYNKASEIFWASGACMFIRADVFKSFNGFDEDFFAHMEEVDLCWRIKNTGYKIMYCHESTVYHVGGGTLHKSNPHKTFLNFRNNLYTIYKNVTEEKLFRILYLRLFLDGIAGLKFILSFQLKNCIAIIKAHRAFFNELPQLRQKRTVLQQQSLHPNKTANYKGMLILEYYLKRKKTYQELT